MRSSTGNATWRGVRRNRCDLTHWRHKSGLYGKQQLISMCQVHPRNPGPVLPLRNPSPGLPRDCPLAWLSPRGGCAWLCQSPLHCEMIPSLRLSCAASVSLESPPCKKSLLFTASQAGSPAEGKIWQPVCTNTAVSLAITRRVFKNSTYFFNYKNNAHL